MRNKVKRTQQGVTVEFTGQLVDNNTVKMYEMLGLDIDLICPGDIENAIGMADGKPILLRVNSIGGSIVSGMEMYTRIMDYQGQVNFDILSVSASAASVVSMAAAKEGNRCRISPLGMMVVHNVQNKVQGDYRDMDEAAANLRKLNSTIITAYQKKTGLPEAQIQEMLDKETWITAREAIDMGFADEVMFEEGDITDINPGLSNTIMTKTRELMNAIPSLDAASLRRMMEAQKQKNAQQEKNSEMEASLQFAAMQLEMEKNRF